MNFINYYEDFRDKIFSYFYYNLDKDREIAEDLTSETFLKGFKKFETYDSKYEFSTWIFAIARNNLRDFFKKNKIDFSLDSENGDLEIIEFSKFEQDFDKKIDTEIMYNKALNAMQNINSNYKDIIVMKYLSDFSTKEIAQITGKKESSVRKIISRGLKMILEILESNKRNYEKF